VLVSCLYRLDTSTTPTKPGTGAGKLFTAPVPGLVGVVLYPPLKPPPTELVLDPRP
jgi:hypothetical protein